MSADQEMQDEGMAREIVNRIQKLRKKAHLVPTDQINVYYSIVPQTSDLNRVAKTYRDFIELSIKSPFIESNAADNTFASETQEVSMPPHRLATNFVRKVRTRIIFTCIFLRTYYS